MMINDNNIIHANPIGIIILILAFIYLKITGVELKFVVHYNATRGEWFNGFHFFPSGFFYHHFRPMTDEIFECAHSSASKIFVEKKSNLRVNQFPHTRDNNNARTITT